MQLHRSSQWFGVWVVCLVVGCAEGKPPTGTDSGSTLLTPSVTATLFPHPDNWETGAAHGPAVGTFGLAACETCHIPNDQTPGRPPGCPLCHALYPHANGWTSKANHGAWVLKNGKASCMTQCHGTDLQGGLSGVACTTCHTRYPHPSDWKTSSVHGPVARGVGKALCRACHGSDLLGGTSGVSCTRCHEQYPHVAGWIDAAQHGAFVGQHGPAGCATACHGTDLQGGVTGIACDSCHTLYPHDAAWPTSHGQTTRTLGKTACAGCHGADFKTLFDGKNCYTCHPDYPHPDPATWEPFTGGHGERVNVAYGGVTTSCTPCHGADLSTVIDDKNCASCHPAYPHPATTAWKSFEGHGQYTLLHKKIECQLCHGEGYDGGVRKNPSCLGCHGGAYPHLPGWALPPGQPQGHATFVQKSGTTSCATANCHGVGLVPKPKVTQGPECTACHTAFPHPAGWKAGTLHGPIALADIDGCKSCHGAALDQAPKGFQSCKDCHASFASHDIAKPAVFGWGLKGHGAYVLTPISDKAKKLTECRLCHGPSYMGGLANTSCKGSSCHSAYPHGPGWKPGVGHGVTAVPAIDQCKMCHGAELNTAPTGFQACADCHASYLPHKTAKIAGPGWLTGHGPWFLTPPTATEKAKKLTECQSCHAATYTKGIANKQGCKGCHATYPHDDPLWAGAKHGTEVRAAQGTTTFAKAQTACGMCHGNTLTGGAAGIGCGQCHATYPHVVSGWGAAVAHGKEALAQKTAPPQMPCTTCHGDPVAFSETDTKASLAVQKASPYAPTCYACHWAYPHGSWNTLAWAPVMTYSVDSQGAPCGIGSPKGFGHIMYIAEAPLFVTAAGQHPPTDNFNDALWTSAIHNTCGGGTSGSCHFDGHRSFKSSNPLAACGQYCHGPALPAPPTYPPCPAPPPTPCNPAEEEC